MCTCSFILNVLKVMALFYLLKYLTSHWMVPFRLINNEHTEEIFLASGQQLCDRFYVLILRTGREDYSSQDDTLTSHQLQAPKHVCRCGSLVSCHKQRRTVPAQVLLVTYTEQGNHTPTKMFTLELLRQNTKIRI